MLKKIQQYIKDNWKFIVFLVVFYLVMNYELPYVIYTPGGAINMSERVTGDNTYDESGSLSMTYVSMVKGSLPFLALSYVIPNWDIVSSKDISYDGDLKTTVEIDKIYMKEAISNAESVAYDKAEIEYSIKNTKNIVTYVDSKACSPHSDYSSLMDIPKIMVNFHQESLKTKYWRLTEMSYIP